MAVFGWTPVCGLGGPKGMQTADSAIGRSQLNMRRGLFETILFFTAEMLCHFGAPERSAGSRSACADLRPERPATPISRPSGMRQRPRLQSVSRKYHARTTARLSWTPAILPEPRRNAASRRWLRMDRDGRIFGAASRRQPIGLPPGLCRVRRFRSFSFQQFRFRNRKPHDSAV